MNLPKADKLFDSRFALLFYDFPPLFLPLGRGDREIINPSAQLLKVYFGLFIHSFGFVHLLGFRIVDAKLTRSTGRTVAYHHLVAGGVWIDVDDGLLSYGQLVVFFRDGLIQRAVRHHQHHAIGWGYRSIHFACFKRSVEPTSIGIVLHGVVVGGLRP